MRKSKERQTAVETAASNPAPDIRGDDHPPVAPAVWPVCGRQSASSRRPPQPGLCLPAATDYTIVKGDILEKIAPKFHVSVKAITDANPGLEQPS